MAADASTWLAEHPQRVIGLRVDEACAEIAAAGLRPRTMRPGAIVTAEFRQDRVSLQTDEADIVTGATAG